jgi:hypothetical protein
VANSGAHFGHEQLVICVQQHKVIHHVRTLLRPPLHIDPALDIDIVGYHLQEYCPVFIVDICFVNHLNQQVGVVPRSLATCASSTRGWAAMWL